MAPTDLTNGAGGVFRDEVVRPGYDHADVPPHGADVTVHYEGFLLNGQKFDSSRDRDEEFTFKLGVGQVIEGWDIAVAKMKPNELSVFTCRADYAYGWEGKPPTIPVDATLRFQIELIRWACLPASSAPPSKQADMSPAEKLAHGKARREAGTTMLKAGLFEGAAPHFEAAVESLSAVHSVMVASSVAPSANSLEEATGALRACLLNLSQCELNLERWGAAASNCTRVLGLGLEASNTKAQFRRGLAYAALERHEEATADLKAVCLADPKSREAREAYATAKAALAAHAQSERQAFGGMFKV